MKMILKVLGALLVYPQQGLVEALPELRAVINDDGKLPSKHKLVLEELIEELQDGDLLHLQEAYVDLFDRGRATSLHLFEHVHGDSRDRGMAMVDLRGMYERAGFGLKAGELPDYLPAVLEFLSFRPEEEVRDMLGDCAHILRKIGDALAERDSRYYAVLAALLALVDEPGLTPAKLRQPAREEKSLDEEWAEEPVVFGPGAAPACGARQPQTSVIHFMPRAHQDRSRNSYSD